VIGQVFGRLTVVGPAPSIGTAKAWLCRCSCGSEVVKEGRRLRHARVKSCGCLVRENAPIHGRLRRNRVNLSGRVFGRLTVLGETPRLPPNTQARIRYECRCDCPGRTIVSVPGVNLTQARKPTRSCGCLRSEAAKARYQTIRDEARYADFMRRLEAEIAQDEAANGTPGEQPVGRLPVRELDGSERSTSNPLI
jgi:hypothetical protein